MPTMESAAGAIRKGEVMNDKAVGKLWVFCLVIYGDDRKSFEKDNIVQLIHKLVKERAHSRRYTMSNKPREWTYEELALREFGIDPKEWLKAELIADTKADILKIYRRLHPDE